MILDSERGEEYIGFTMMCAAFCFSVNFFFFTSMNKFSIANRAPAIDFRGTFGKTGSSSRYTEEII